MKPVDWRIVGRGLIITGATLVLFSVVVAVAKVELPLYVWPVVGWWTGYFAYDVARDWGSDG